MDDKASTYAGKLKDVLTWWLGTKRPFFINEDYKLELLHIDRNNESVKIRITNLKNNTVVEQEVVDDNRPS